MNRLISDIIKSLKNASIENNEAHIEADLLIEFVSGVTKKELLLNPNKEFDSKEKSRIIELAKKRAETKMPIQYIIGKAHFMGEDFEVDKHTLIPRPETELLVNEAIKISKKFNNPKIVDIGTGTACIAIMMAKNIKTEYQIIACDIADETIQTAQKNRSKFNLDREIKIIKSDLLDSIDEKFNIIVSNPPYIPVKQKEELQQEVTNFEPHRALFAEDELGINIYQRIIEQSKTKLSPNGYILFELGINQSDTINELLKKNGFKNIKILKDLANIDRVIIAQS